MKTAHLLLTALSLALLSGCSTRNEYIQLRRDQELMAKRELDRKKTPLELRYERQDLRASRRLQSELKYWEAYYSNARTQNRRLVQGISEDPWRAYELDRRATFHRKWSDEFADPQPLVPDTDGPPGWLGPRLPPSQGGAVDPEADEAFQGDTSEDDGGGDDDDWGDDGGDDDGGDDGDGDDGGGGDDDWGDDDW